MARIVPRLRKAGEMADEPTERARVERWHEELDRSLPTGSTARFDRRFSVVTDQLPTGFPAYSIVRRGAAPTETVLYLHGGGYMAPISAWQVRYAARMADDLGVRVVLPDYPLAPEHSWRDSHDELVVLATRLATEGDLVLAGDSSGGGLALALAESLRDRGGPQPRRLLLISPWVDLTRGSSSARSMRTPRGGPAAPTTSVGRRSAPVWATWRDCRPP
jgi:monoterpene epsilon-lactone hydrolase